MPRVMLSPSGTLKIIYFATWVSETVTYVNLETITKKRLELPVRRKTPKEPHHEDGMQIKEVRRPTPANVKKKFQCTPYSPTCSCTYIVI